MTIYDRKNAITFFVEQVLGSACTPIILSYNFVGLISVLEYYQSVGRWLLSESAYSGGGPVLPPSSILSYKFCL